MGNHKYQYLFPYERVPAGSRILIYGAGDLGQDYLLQMQITNYCEVVALADKNFSEYPPMIVPVIDPETIREWRFDYVIVALRVAVAANEIFRILQEQGVSKDKIVYIFERGIGDISLFAENNNLEDGICSCDSNELSIALLITGGLGDHVIQKRLLMELINLAPGIPIDIYAIRHVAYLKYLYSDCKTIKNVFEDLGIRYNKNRNRYTFSMSIEACHYLRVDVFKRELIASDYSELARRLDILERETVREGIDLSIPVHVSNLIRQYRGLDAYSGFNYNGAFDIKDKTVHFPLTDIGEIFYRELKIQNYVTVNYGSGECRDGSKVAKMWPFARFEKVISMIKEQYPDLSVIQLGISGAPKMTGADQYILGEKMENVASVLNHAMFHLDIEGGLVHIASQLGTKCIVLFGPTVENYYGYKENINIRAGNCHDCWALYSDVNRCARDMTEPECMYSITPELVMKHIEQYMSTIRYDNE